MATQRGRKSVASNVVSIASVGLRPTIVPMRALSKLERSIFDLIVKEHRHLRALDAPLLTIYVIASAKVLTLKAINPSDFKKLVGVVTTLAVKLRLSPSSAMRAEALGRRYIDPNVPSGRKPWERKDDASA